MCVSQHYFSTLLYNTLIYICLFDIAELVRTLDKARNAKEKHEALNDIADHHNRNGNYEEALKFYEVICERHCALIRF